MKDMSSLLDGWLETERLWIRAYQDAEQLIANIATNWENRVRLIIPFFLKQGDRLAGELYIGGFLRIKKSAEFGYFVFKDYENKGLAYEAARAGIEAAFGELGLNELVLHCNADNKKSIRLAQKLGFKLKRSRRTQTRQLADGTITTVLDFFLLAQSLKKTR